MKPSRRLVLSAFLGIAAAVAVPPGLGLTFRHHELSIAGRRTSDSRRSASRVTRAVPTPVPRPPAPLSPRTTVLAFPAPPVLARAAIVVDEETGRVLFQKDADARLAMASTTKITTAAVVLQHARLSDMVATSRNAATVGESTMSLRQGERLSVRDMLYGMLLNSGNDAAVALAEHVGGTEPRFVAMMNALAHRLHMRNTHYATPHGLDAPGHYTSARDLATITLYAMRDPTFRRIVSTQSYHIPRTKHNQEHWLGNINKALYWYPGADGVKPGQTDDAGLCLDVSAWRNGRHILAIVLDTPNLVTDIRNLLNMGARDFGWIPSIFSLDQPSNVMSGASGSSAWTYFFGAGHYVRGSFLAYFNAHGGLRTLGYPRTEQIDENGQNVQYFEGGELVEAATGDAVYPASLGTVLSQRDAAARVERGSKEIWKPFRALYKTLAGRGILGAPITAATRDHGTPVQFFQDGEMAMSGGAATMVPAGDAALKLKGWMPAIGPGNIYPPTMNPGLLSWFHPPVHHKPAYHLPMSVLAHRFADSQREAS